MWCLACAERPGRPLCRACALDRAPGPRLRLDGGVLVHAAFHHHGAARLLVHRLKYHGLVAAGEVLSEAMAPLVPPQAMALVPLPRAAARRLRHGVDPALVLAQQLSKRVELPVVRCLAPSWWWPRHAVAAHDGRRPARFSLAARVPPGSVLIDDVLTSGATMAAAARLTGVVRHGIVATSPGRVGVDGAQRASDGGRVRRR